MTNFRLPGPTPLPPAVMEAMQRPMISHRGPAMKDLYRSLQRRLQEVHRTEAPVYVWPGSGSAGWELGVTNLLSPGDRVLAVVTGDFGDRFAKVGIALGLDVRRLDIRPGAAATVESLTAALSAHGPVRAVFLTHNETSTGVTNPIRQLAAVARDHGALVLVDAVSSAAGLPLLVDEWDLDFVLSGSQKAWMCPPGMMIAAIGPRAWDARKQSTYRRFFWDIEAMKATAEQGMTPATPPLSGLYALDVALDTLLTEGMDNVWARHARLGDLVRTGAEEMGLSLFADRSVASNTVTAISTPNGMSAKAILDRARSQFDLELAAGQGSLSDAMVRIGHMGWVGEPELREALDLLGQTLVSLGVSLTPAGSAA